MGNASFCVVITWLHYKPFPAMMQSISEISAKAADFLHKTYSFYTNSHRLPLPGSFPSPLRWFFLHSPAGRGIPPCPSGVIFARYPPPWGPGRIRPCIRNTGMRSIPPGPRAGRQCARRGSGRPALRHGHSGCRDRAADRPPGPGAGGAGRGHPQPVKPRRL